MAYASTLVAHKSLFSLPTSLIFNPSPHISLFTTFTLPTSISLITRRRAAATLRRRRKGSRGFSTTISPPRHLPLGLLPRFFFLFLRRSRVVPSSTPTAETDINNSALPLVRVGVLVKLSLFNNSPTTCPAASARYTAQAPARTMIRRHNHRCDSTTRSPSSQSQNTPSTQSHNTPSAQSHNTATAPTHTNLPHITHRRQFVVGDGGVRAVIPHLVEFLDGFRDPRVSLENFDGDKSLSECRVLILRRHEAAEPVGWLLARALVVAVLQAAASADGTTAFELLVVVGRLKLVVKLFII